MDDGEAEAARAEIDRLRGELERERAARLAMAVTSAVTARRLATELSRTAALAAELADAEVFEATRSRRHAIVADALGVSVAAVRKAIQQHNRRQGALTVGADSDTQKSTNGAQSA